MVFTFLIPVTALLLVRILDGSLSRRRFTVLLMLTLVGQLLLATEILFTLSCLVVAALVAGWLVGDPSTRRRISAAVAPVAAAYAGMAIIGSPYLYYALFRGHSVSVSWAANFPADVLAFVTPTSFSWIGSHTFAGSQARSPPDSSRTARISGLLS